MGERPQQECVVALAGDRIEFWKYAQHSSCSTVGQRLSAAGELAVRSVLFNQRALDALCLVTNSLDTLPIPVPF